MFGNGIANIVAAAIVAASILWSGGINKSNAAAPSDKDFSEWYARAVGDIRNDIVVNCGCCGDEEGQRRADTGSF